MGGVFGDTIKRVQDLMQGRDMNPVSYTHLMCIRDRVQNENNLGKIFLHNNALRFVVYRCRWQKDTTNRRAKGQRACLLYTSRCV